MEPLPALAGDIASGQRAIADLPVETGEKRGEGAEGRHSRLEGRGTATGTTDSVAGTGGEGGAGGESFRKWYLARLMAHIEAHKFYPPAARSRRLEGGAQIQFTLGANGGVNNLRVSSAEPLLEKAARESVERALPLPLPQEQGIIPLAVSYRMEFQLR